MEDNCSLPSLQDMFDLEDFDATRLEELAESLLADVTTELEQRELEDDATKGGYRTAQIESKSKPMLRSMVGTKAKKLESSQNTNGSIKTAAANNNLITTATMTPTTTTTIPSTPAARQLTPDDEILCHPEAIAINAETIKQEIVDCLPMDEDLEDLYICPDDAPNNQINQMHYDEAPFSNSSNHNHQLFHIENIIDTNTISTDAIEPNHHQHHHTAASTDFNESMILRHNAATTATICDTADPKTNDNINTSTENEEFLYEATYDDEGNLITVILPDEDISHFEEVIEEQQTSAATATATAATNTIVHDDDEYISPDSNVSALSPITSINYASPGYNYGDDPTGSTSDHDSAYDSVINSPPGKLSSSWSTTSSMVIDDDYQCYDYWPQDSFSVLFPSLA